MELVWSSQAAARCQRSEVGADALRDRELYLEMELVPYQSPWFGSDLGKMQEDGRVNVLEFVSGQRSFALLGAVMWEAEREDPVPGILDVGAIAHRMVLRMGGFRRGSLQRRSCSTGIAAGNFVGRRPKGSFVRPGDEEDQEPAEAGGRSGAGAGCADGTVNGCAVGGGARWGTGKPAPELLAAPRRGGSGRQRSPAPATCETRLCRRVARSGRTSGRTGSHVPVGASGCRPGLVGGTTGGFWLRFGGTKILSLPSQLAER